MLYLLDANVLIRAHEDYYPIDRIPQFWEWLVSMGKNGTVKIPHEIYSEIEVSRGMLHDWLVDKGNSTYLLLDQQTIPADANKIVEIGYGKNLNESEIDQIANDPFLVAYALRDLENTTIVTKEVSAPSKQRANRKIPDVCKQFDIHCINDFSFYRELEFKIV